MSSLNIETKRKLHEMNATDMLQAIEAQDETLSMGLTFEERGLNRNTLTGIGSCAFIEQNQNVVFQGFTGSGKSYLGCALAKQACRNRIRTHYVRIPDLEEECGQAEGKPPGAAKILKNMDRSRCWS